MSSINFIVLFISFDNKSSEINIACWNNMNKIIIQSISSKYINPRIQNNEKLRFIYLLETQSNKIRIKINRGPPE